MNRHPAVLLLLVLPAALALAAAAGAFAPALAAVPAAKRTGGAAVRSAPPHVVDLGAFTSRVPGGAELAELYRKYLTRRLEESAVDFALARSRGPGHLELRGTVLRTTTTRAPAGTTVRVAVTLVALRLPGDELVTAADAEARVAVEGASSREEEAGLRREALAAAADETFAGLKKALRR